MFDFSRRARGTRRERLAPRVLRASVALQAFHPKQYSRPSVDPTTTRPAATDGDAVIASPTSNSHRFWPVPASRTYSLPSLDPTYTRPPATTGDESTRARVTNFQA